MRKGKSEATTERKRDPRPQDSGHTPKIHPYKGQDELHCLHHKTTQFNQNCITRLSKARDNDKEALHFEASVENKANTSLVSRLRRLDIERLSGET